MKKHWFSNDPAFPGISISPCPTWFGSRPASGKAAQIPTIDKLEAEGGVARAAIRLPLDLLEDEELIERYGARGCSCADGLVRICDVLSGRIGWACYTRAMT